MLALSFVHDRRRLGSEALNIWQMSCLYISIGLVRLFVAIFVLFLRICDKYILCCHVAGCLRHVANVGS